MKHLALLFVALLTLGGSTYAAEENTTVRRGNIYDGSKYIFVEDGIEFSVFPDGEFDFYIPRYVDGVSINIDAGPVGISFNTGFNYDPYVQYDQFGAVIQIENTPLYYDNFGRLVQAGNVNINYRRNRIARVGGLRIFYNNAGFFSHYTGFINVYNRGYVFHPYHNFYYRPIFDRCLVFNTPYRQFYNPLRYDYAFHRNNYFRGYNNGYANARRDFRRPNRGRVAHNNGRRGNVDRNNARFNNARPSANYENRATRSSTRGRNSNSRAVAQNRSTNRVTSANRAERSGRTQAKPRATSTRTNMQRRSSVAQGSNRSVKPREQSRSPRANSSRASSTRKAIATRNRTSRAVGTNSNTQSRSRAAQRPTQKRMANAPSRSRTQSASRSTNNKSNSSSRSRRGI